MVHNDVIYHEQPFGMGGLDQMLQVSQAAPVRGHFVEVTAGIAVELAVAVEHNGRNPDGCGAESLDVIQLLFQPFEIAAMNRSAVAGIVIALGIIVGRVAVVIAVGHDLVDALRLPEAVREGLRAGYSRQET